MPCQVRIKIHAACYKKCHLICLAIKSGVPRSILTSCGRYVCGIEPDQALKAEVSFMSR